MTASEIRKIRDAFYNPTHDFDRNGGKLDDIKQPVQTVVYDGTLAGLATLVGLAAADVEPEEILCWEGNAAPDYDAHAASVNDWLAERCYPALTVVDWVLPHWSLCNAWGWDTLRQMAEVQSAGLQVPKGSSHNGNGRRTILSLFDRTGNWSKPYAEAGYEVLTVDIQPAASDRFNHIQMDVLERVTWYDEQLDEEIECSALEALMREWRESGVEVDGILAACPCDHFAGAGARHFAAKDADGRTDTMVDLVALTTGVIEFWQPEFWVIENPKGRINTLLPELGQPTYFHPHQFGHPYSKETGLWGSYNRDLPMMHVEPVPMSENPIWAKLGGKSARTKALRSITPMGMAQAFYEANNWGPQGVSETPIPEYYNDVMTALELGA